MDDCDMRGIDGGCALQERQRAQRLGVGRAFLEIEGIGTGRHWGQLLCKLRGRQFSTGGCSAKVIAAAGKSSVDCGCQIDAFTSHTREKSKSAEGKSGKPRKM
jgi:hypothetical protein